jgi:hypothetical protein
MVVLLLLPLIKVKVLKLVAGGCGGVRVLVATLPIVVLIVRIVLAVFTLVVLLLLLLIPFDFLLILRVEFGSYRLHLCCHWGGAVLF